MPQCWLSNWTAQAMALARVNPEVAVTAPDSFSHRGWVTYLATRECLDLISGKVSDMVAVVGGCLAAAERGLILTRDI